MSKLDFGLNFCVGFLKLHCCNFFTLYCSNQMDVDDSADASTSNFECSKIGLS